LAADSKGSNTGTLTNGPSWVDGKYGKALSLDGVDDSVQFPAVNSTQVITLSLWIKSSNATGWRGDAVYKAGSYTIGPTVTGGLDINFSVNTTVATHDLITTVNDHQNWHHVVGTYDSATSTQKIYVDGVLKNTRTTTGTVVSNGNPIQVLLTGSVDEVRIYNRALTSAEVTTLYHNGLSESATWELGSGRPLSETDVNGQTISFEHDTFKRITKVIKPGDSSASPSVTYNYNSWGTLNSQNLETVVKIDGSNSLWSKQYFDGIGQVVQIQAKGETEGATTYTVIQETTSFNTQGRLDKKYVSQKLDSTQVSGYKVPEASWKYISFVYDDLGEVSTLTNPDGTTITYTRDYANAPWQVTSTNARGVKNRQSFDANGRLTKVAEYDFSHSIYATANYTYDLLGNLTKVQDNSSNLTTIRYDALSRKIGMSDPDMGNCGNLTTTNPNSSFPWYSAPCWNYDYDANGNLARQRDGKTQDIYFQYDALNRMTCKSTAASCTGTILAQYTYDDTASGNMGKGKRTGMTDASGSMNSKYDSRGRLTEEKRTVDSTIYTTSFTYDGADRVTTITYPDGDVVTNGFNGAGLPRTVSGSVVGNLVTETLYNPLRQISQIDLGNGLRNVFHYHGLDAVDGGDATSYWGKLYRIRTYKVSDSTDRLHLKYWWDAGSNLTQRKDVQASETETFTYDFLDRLTGASGPYTESYAYNAIGNITNKNGTSYTYGSSKPHAVTAVGSAIYAYDANGNMTDRGTQDLSWDAENRLASVTAVSSGLKANWRFEEGSGTSAQDSTGNGYTGTLVNGPTWATAGKEGKALSFDGVNDKVTYSPAIAGHPFTVCLWAKQNGSAATSIWGGGRHR